MAGDKTAQLRNLIAGYGNSMRLSDIKALIAVLFVAIMMLTVVQYRALYPWYLSVPVILTPFMIIYLSLLISVYPRFPRAGRALSRDIHDEDRRPNGAVRSGCCRVHTGRQGDSCQLDGSAGIRCGRRPGEIRPANAGRCSAATLIPAQRPWRFLPKLKSSA